MQPAARKSECADLAGLINFDEMRRDISEENSATPYSARTWLSVSTAAGRRSALPAPPKMTIWVTSHQKSAALR